MTAKPERDDDVVPTTPRLSLRKRTITQRLWAMVDGLDLSTRHRKARRVVRFPLFAARVLVQVVKQWARDHCPQQAASLAFSTALSIVPMIAIALALLRATGEFEAESSLVAFLAREVLPSISRDEIAQYLIGFAGKLSIETAGIAGIATTLILSFVMYMGVEKIFNDIWRVDRRRSIAQLFVTFYAMATMVPAALGISLYHATQIGLTEGWMGWFSSLAATFSALFLANKLLPATRVKWGAAAAGALFTAIAFEAAKRAFQLYVANVAFQKYAGVYGTMALVPIVLLWIYYSWLMVLLGAEIAHIVQNLHQLEGTDRRGEDRDRQTKVNGLAGARFLCAIVERWRETGLATPRDELAARFSVTEEATELVLKRLREGGLVVEVDGDVTGFLPGRPPGDISLADVLAVFRGTDLRSREPGVVASRLDEVLTEIDETTRGRAARVTIDELSR
jgi:membrane protein